MGSCLKRLCCVVAAALASHAFGVAQAGTLSAPQATEPDTFDSLQNNVWYVPTADGRAQLYVTSIGHGPTVVVLHGGPGNDFNYLVDWLRPQASHYRFIFFDQRGSLLSPVADVSSLRMTDLVSDLETLRKALGENRMVLLGHSFGTILAEFYFQAHPEHVASLILTGAAPPSTAPGNFGQFVRAIQRRQDALRRRAAVTAAKRDAGVLTRNDAVLAPEQAMRLFKIDNAAIDLYHVDRWHEFQGGGVYYNRKVDDAIGNSLPDTYDIGPELTRYSIPISIIQGDHDYIDPSASAWRFDAQRMPNVHISVIDDAGHYSWIDAPLQFNRSLIDALRRAFTPRQP